MNLETAPGATTARGGKSEAAFRTISEVAEELDVPQHVLRFWESRFPQIKPLKRGGGRRYYRPADVQLLRRIRDLLYKDGYTIKGVQKLLKDGKTEAKAEAKPAAAPAEPPPPPKPAAPELPLEPAPKPQADKQALRAVLEDLLEIRGMLRGG